MSISIEVGTTHNHEAIEADQMQDGCVYVSVRRSTFKKNLPLSTQVDTSEHLPIVFIANSNRYPGGVFYAFSPCGKWVVGPSYASDHLFVKIQAKMTFSLPN